MNALATHIQATFGVSEPELQAIQSFFEPLTLAKGEFYLQAGRTSNRLGFVQSGILREFAYVGDREITKWISTEGYFAVDLSSFLFQQPARFNIQALADTELQVLTIDQYRKIREVIPRWPELEKLFIAKCFTVLEDRVMAHLSLSAEDRFRQFFAFQPELFNQVPLTYLASLLGMTPETLSRLRRKSGQGSVT